MEMRKRLVHGFEQKYEKQLNNSVESILAPVTKRINRIKIGNNLKFKMPLNSRYHSNISYECSPPEHQEVSNSRNECIYIFVCTYI